MKLEAKKLVWDGFNIKHIEKHNVTMIEVIEACKGEILALEGKKGRFLLFGWTKNKRLLAVILASKNGTSFYPVTARDASRKERKILKQKGLYASV